MLDHYLEILAGKPGALPGSTALAQARAAGRFTAVHEAFWAVARARHGDAAGTRVLIEVLLLHRRMPAAAVIAGIATTLEAGSTSPELVAIEARKADRSGDDAEGPVRPGPDPTAAAAGTDEDWAAFSARFLEGDEAAYQASVRAFGEEQA